jgi:hypothetical protein
LPFGKGGIIPLALKLKISFHLLLPPFVGIHKQLFYLNKCIFAPSSLMNNLFVEASLSRNATLGQNWMRFHLFSSSYHSVDLAALSIIEGHSSCYKSKCTIILSSIASMGTKMKQEMLILAQLSRVGKQLQIKL